VRIVFEMINLLLASGNWLSSPIASSQKPVTFKDKKDK
jgi:hypothetical protein